MDDAGDRWRRLSPAWKAFFVAFAVLLIFLAVQGWYVQPHWWILVAAIWAAAIAGVVRLIDRARNPYR